MAVEAELVDELVQLSFAVMAALSRVGAGHDLSLTQLRLLGILRDRQAGVTELARRLGLDKSTVSGLVDRAVRRGLVERIADPGDGRAVRVTLSAPGRQLATAAEAEVTRLMTPLTDPLSAPDRRRLHALLTRMGGVAPPTS